MEICLCKAEPGEVFGWLFEFRSAEFDWLELIQNGLLCMARNRLLVSK